MNQFSLLATRRFLPLFLAQFLGALNDNIYRFALVIFVTYRLAGESGLSAGTLVVASGGIFILPFFLFSAWAGQLADKLEKSRLIRLIKAVEIGLMGLGAVGFWLGSVPLLFLVLFLMGTHSTFFGPVKYGILPQHLTREELTGGNALIQMATYIAILCGTLLGGTLAALESTGPVAVVACVVGVAVLGFRAACVVPAAPPPQPDLRIDWRPDRATAQLLRLTLRNRPLLVLTLLNSWFWFEGATFLSLVPTYGKELLNANEAAVTVLTAAFTVGIGVGSLLCEWLSRRQVELALVPPAALGLSLCALDIAWRGVPALPPVTLEAATLWSYPPASRLFLDLAGIGAFGALYVVPLTAALQAAAPEETRSRVIAALNVVNAAFMVGSAIFTLALFGVGATHPQVFGATALLNIGVIAAGVAALPEFRQRLRARFGKQDAAPTDA